MTSRPIKRRLVKRVKSRYQNRAIVGMFEFGCSMAQISKKYQTTIQDIEQVIRADFELRATTNHEGN